MRHRARRKIGFDYDNMYYKPQGIPLSSLEEVVVSPEELETLRLSIYREYFLKMKLQKRWEYPRVSTKETWLNTLRKNYQGPNFR